MSPCADGALVPTSRADSAEGALVPTSGGRSAEREAMLFQLLLLEIRRRSPPNGPAVQPRTASPCAAARRAASRRNEAPQAPGPRTAVRRLRPRVGRPSPLLSFIPRRSCDQRYRCFRYSIEYYSRL